MALYVRIRGKIFGPFEESQLQEMVKRGKLGRNNDISTDGVNWVRAEENEDLFPKKSPEQNYSSQQHPAATPQEPATWFYSIDGQTGSGPYLPSTIIGMVQSGVIRADTILWQEGGSPEQLIRTPEFAAYMPSRKKRQTGSITLNETSEMVSRELAKPVIDSGTWVFVIFLLMLVGGVMTLLSYLVHGIIAAKHNPLVGVVVFIVGLIPLFCVTISIIVYGKYSSRVKKFSFNPTEENLRQTLTALTLWWKICILIPAAIMTWIILLFLLVYLCTVMGTPLEGIPPIFNA